MSTGESDGVGRTSAPRSAFANCGLGVEALAPMSIVLAAAVTVRKCTNFFDRDSAELYGPARFFGKRVLGALHVLSV